MKKRLVALVAVLLCVISVFMLTQFRGHAASTCLSVRDYGRHIYNHRVYSKKYIKSDYYNGYPVRDYYEIYGECVCGAVGTEVVVYGDF